MATAVYSLSVSVIQSLAHNVSRWRRRRGISISDLARLAGLSKSTLSELERGRGNPSMDTIAALANALSLPFDALFAEHGTAEFDIVRASGMPTVSKTSDWSATLLAQMPAVGDLEIYRLSLAAGASRSLTAHNFGASETVYVMTGSVRIETNSASETLRPGDMAVFSANIERRFRAVDGPAEFLMLNRYIDTERIVQMRIQRQARGQY